MVRCCAAGGFHFDVRGPLRVPTTIKSDAATRMAAVRVIATMTTGDFINVPSARAARHLEGNPG